MKSKEFFGMKRMILTGTLALATGILPVMAQQQKGAAPQDQKGGQPAGQQQQQLVPGTKSPGESQAVIALIQAAQTGNPDAVIKAADELITKYADTTFKETAYLQEADAYQRKNDAVNAQIYGEKALEVNPKSYQAELTLGEILATKTRENDLDKEEKLTKATKYLNDAIANVQAAAKPNPQLSDAQWEEGKKYVVAEAHNGLGMVALVRKKYDVAATEFKTAADTDPQPAYLVRLASAYHSAGKEAEAIAICDKVLADPQLHPQIKSVATQIKNAASAAKK
jgi:tetratricopeptide (TPR) repeat protein